MMTHLAQLHAVRIRPQRDIKCQLTSRPSMSAIEREVKSSSMPASSTRSVSSTDATGRPGKVSAASYVPHSP